jgi:formylglycine-generating enzyme required for sulfatase activity
MTGTECFGGDCCASPLVTGGSFYRSYDGVTDPLIDPITNAPEVYTMYTDAIYPATVSDFRLDKYETTVSRFRGFVAAWVGGWRPGSGAGKHSHLNGGKGLADVDGGYEPGWDTSWNSLLPATEYDWTIQLLYSPYALDYTNSWYMSAGPNQQMPINTTTWYAAYAFCIWDGGFLPSEAEWNYAAAGGAEQRQFPWSSPSTSPLIGCTYANYDGSVDGKNRPYGGKVCSPTPNQIDGEICNAVGSEAPKGDGLYGQSDLAGNELEWTLDAYGAYVTPCTDCARTALGSAGTRVLRGGSANDYDYNVRTSPRWATTPTTHRSYMGFRCARSP